MRRLLLILLIPAAVTLAPTLYVLGPPYWAYWCYAPQPGDVVFQSLPRAPLVNAIEGATQSPWSHCGIVAYEDGGWVVYEALGHVRKTPLFTFFARSRGWRFAACRWRPDAQEHVPAMLDYARGCLGRPYDVRYEMDEEKLYCSELIYKAWQAATGRPIGRLVRLGELRWQPYRALIESLEQGPVPVDREMITPRDLAVVEELERVASYGLSAGATGVDGRQ